MILPKLAFMWLEIVVRLVDGNYKSSQSPGVLVFRRCLTSSEYGCVEVFDREGGGVVERNLFQLKGKNPQTAVKV